MAAKHTPQNERPTNTNKIAAPGGVTAMRGGFALIPRKEALQKTFGKWERVSRALLRNTLPTIGDCKQSPWTARHGGFASIPRKEALQ